MGRPQFTHPLDAGQLEHYLQEAETDRRPG